MQLRREILYERIWNRVGPVPIPARDASSLIATAEAASRAITAALDGFTSHPDADALRAGVWEEVLDVLIGCRGCRQPDATNLAIMSKRPLP